MMNDRIETIRPPAKIVVGTRGSELARWQTNFIITALRRLAPGLEIETRIIKTEGDKDQVHPLAEFGGLGVFTKAIEDALLTHEIDLAVHSLKDLPTETAAGLSIVAVPEREDPRDCLVSRHGLGLFQLPPGARIGTSSARRRAQVLALRPDVLVIPLRGNVDTRLRKAGTEQYDAIILATAGLARLGRTKEITEYLPLERFLPDPGQGALAVEIRSDDRFLERLARQLDHVPTRRAVIAERSFLQALGGGCRMPIGAYGEIRQGALVLHGVVASDDGSHVNRGEMTGDSDEAEQLGARLAKRLMGASEETSSPLHNKRILVTRAEDQAQPLIERIRQLGGDPVQFPTIGFAPLEDFGTLDAALERADRFNWIVFTSANGVRFVAERMQERGQGVQTLSGGRVAAIGPATARALESLGIRVDFVPTRFLGEQIATELPIEPGQSALLLRADIASDVLARRLIERGVLVTNVNAYRTVRPETGRQRETPDLSSIDAVTFTSSSTVRNFNEILDGRRDALAHAEVFCIGPVTADTAQELGWRVHAVAEEHTIDGLVDAILKYYRTR